jgi:LysM repeat protein
MTRNTRLLIVLVTVLGSFLLLPFLGLPYGPLNWTVHSQPYKQPRPVGETCLYTVRYGDSLASIARRFNTSIAAIAQANAIRHVNRIFGGQTLVISNCRASRCIVYTVHRGDTLFSLARRFNTSVNTIARQNHIVNPTRLFAGQRLLICPGGRLPAPAHRIHTVHRGDTLWSIAMRYGTTPWAIVAANNLRYPWLIYPGQRLRIP